MLWIYACVCVCLKLSSLSTVRISESNETKFCKMQYFSKNLCPRIGKKLVEVVADGGLVTVCLFLPKLINIVSVKATCVNFLNISEVFCSYYCNLFFSGKKYDKTEIC